MTHHGRDNYRICLSHIFKIPCIPDKGRSSRPGVSLEKKCSENMQQIYRKTTMPKCDFNKVEKQLQCNFIEIALWHGYSPVTLLRIFTRPFPKNTSGQLLLY